MALVEEMLGPRDALASVGLAIGIERGFESLERRLAALD
jgi:hypothetical protein